VVSPLLPSNGGNVIELRQTEAVGMLVGQYEELVMGTIPDGACQAAFQFLRKGLLLVYSSD